MRWVIAMATLCCLVFGEKSQALETEDLVLEKGNQVLEILDFVKEKKEIVYSAQTSNNPHYNLNHKRQQQEEDVLVRTRLGRLVGSTGKTTSGVKFAHFSRSALPSFPLRAPT